MAAPISRFRLTGAKLPFKDNNGSANQSAYACVPRARQVERIDDETSGSYNNYKKKANKNDIHGKPPRGCKSPPLMKVMHPCPSTPPPAGIGLSHAERNN